MSIKLNWNHVINRILYSKFRNRIAIKYLNENNEKTKILSCNIVKINNKEYEKGIPLKMLGTRKKKCINNCEDELLKIMRELYGNNYTKKDIVPIESNFNFNYF
jgi:hypothetical protein